MNTIEMDAESSLFLREIREEAQERRNTLVHSLRHKLPHQTRIDANTLRRLLQRHNQAIALLQEFLALHPEDNELVRHAHRLVDSPE